MRSWHTRGHRTRATPRPEKRSRGPKRQKPPKQSNNRVSVAPVTTRTPDRVDPCAQRPSPRDGRLGHRLRSRCHEPTGIIGVQIESARLFPERGTPPRVDDAAVITQTASRAHRLAVPMPHTPIESRRVCARESPRRQIPLECRAALAYERDIETKISCRSFSMAALAFTTAVIIMIGALAALAVAACSIVMIGMFTLVVLYAKRHRQGRSTLAGTCGGA